MDHAVKNHEIIVYDEDGNEIGPLCEEVTVLRKEIDLLTNFTMS